MKRKYCYLKAASRYIVLFVFIFSLVGWYPTFYVLKKSIKREMKKRLASVKSDEKCCYFIFSNKEYNELNWIEKNEFRYNGEMYDVLSEEFYKEGVLIYCFHDSKDSWLFSELQRQNDHGSANSGKARNLQRLMQSVTLVYLIPDKWNSADFQREFRLTVTDQKEYSSFISEVIPPPPENQL